MLLQNGEELRDTTREAEDNSKTIGILTIHMEGERQRFMARRQAKAF